MESIPAAHDPRRRAWILAAASLGAFVATFTGTAVNVALPSLAKAFDVPFAAVQWVVLAYLLTTAALMPIVGRIADMVGKRVVLLAGFATYAAATFAAGLAPDLAWLIAFRLVNGVGSAILTSIGLAIVTDVFPAAQRGRAIGINGAVLSVGVVIGPTLGGFLVDLGWRFVFLAGAPVALAGLLLAAFAVPSYPAGERQRFDLPGALLLSALLASGSLALTLAPERGAFDPWILAATLLVIVGTPAFLAWERRTAQPVLDLALFRNAELSMGLVIALGVFVSIAGTIFVMPFYLEDVLGLAPRNVGLLMSVTPILLVIVAPLAGSLADRFGARRVTVAGLAFAFVGFSLVSTLEADTTALGFVLRFTFVGLGMATFQTPNNTAIMGSAPDGRSGVTGALLGLTRAFGQSGGIAVLGTFWAARVVARAGGEAGDVGQAVLTQARVGAVHDVMHVVQVLVAASLAIAVWDLWRRSARRAGAVDVRPAAHD
mgnify:FL=1